VYSTYNGYQLTFGDLEELLKGLSKALGSQQRANKERKKACHVCGLRIDPNERGLASKQPSGHWAAL
jgi:hypothetical protein